VRDAFVFVVVLGSLPFILKRPAWGVMMFAWLSLMNPHRLTYGAAYDFPFAAIVAVVTLASLAASRQQKNLPLNSFTVTLLLFAAWMTLTSCFALEPDRAWREWNRVMKTYGMIMLTMMALRTERDIREMAWMVALSLGFYGMKGGIFTVLSGGSSHVYGPDDSYIADNNALALALITILPMIWYLQMQATRRYLRLALTALAALTLIAAAGSYSRGALLAGGAMLAFLWLKSRNKIRTGLALVLAAPLVFMVMPEQWFGRMQTIDNYQTDDSAMGRINAWHFAVNVAESHPLGGGYSVFTPNMFRLYAPEPLNHHAAHSIYFQVLGEHGFVGLALFLLMLAFAWRTGSRVIALCHDRPDLKWARDLAAMGQVSLIGYAVGGAFLTMAYYDLWYYIVALLVVVERLLAQQAAAPLRDPAGPTHARAALGREAA
jgi:probable O-glycosylation ligase (exosortase A-associated)